MIFNRAILFLILIIPAIYIHADNDIVKARKYVNNGEYLAAAKLYEQCAAESKTDIETYLMRLHDASECFYMLDDYKNVRRIAQLYSETLKREKKNLDSIVVINLTQRAGKIWGTYYYGQTTSDTANVNYRKAEQQYLAASADSVLDPYDKSGFNEALYMDMAQLYYKWKRYDKALTYLNKLNRTPVVMSQEAMCYARLNEFTTALSLINTALSATKNNEHYEMFRKRGKILMMQQDMEGKDNTEAARSCYEQYVNYQISTIVKRMKGMSELQREQYWLGLHDFLTDCFRLGNSAPELLYNLALFSKGYLLECSINGTKTKKTTWKQVQKALHNNEAAIEFLQYNAKGDNARIGALVLTDTMQHPRFIDLALVGDIENSSTTGSEEGLAAIVWNDSILSLLNNTKKIYFAADGVIHKCPIEYLYPNKSDSLNTSPTCIRLSSTRLLTQKKEVLNTSKIMLCGGIDYNTPQKAISENNDELSYQSLKGMYNSIDSLPGTKNEIDSIRLYRQNTSDVVLEGCYATDTQFRIYAKQFPCIHVATHGYYVPSTKKGTDLKPLNSDESMSQSGLVFAGARYALADSTHIQGNSDGLLSSKELSRLNLSGTDLVVLSACQTAQGEVTADGIYGIQRALKLAGVKAIIASLWDVDDKATAILMSHFYQNLKTDSDVHHAFMSARKQLMEDKFMRFLPSSLSTRSVQLYNYPKYKNAFIMIDIK